MSEEAPRYWDEEASGAVLVLDRPAWQQRAACRGTDPGRFVSSYRQSSPVSVRQAEDLAAEFCNACPVAADCLAYALDALPRVAGVWAGTTEGRRTRLRGRRLSDAGHEQAS